jgi:hypothetical protein
MSRFKKGSRVVRKVGPPLHGPVHHASDQIFGDKIYRSCSVNWDDGTHSEVSEDELMEE